MNMILAAINDAFINVSSQKEEEELFAELQSIKQKSPQRVNTPQSPTVEDKNHVRNYETPIQNKQNGTLSDKNFTQDLKNSRSSNKKSIDSSLFSMKMILKIPERADLSKIYYYAFKISSNSYFIFFFILLVIIYGIVLMIDQYPYDKARTTFMNDFNLYCTGLFSAELILKLLAFGVKDFLREKYNLHEIFVITTSVVEIILSVDYEDSEITEKFKAFRTLRIFRVFQFTNCFKSIRVILKTLTSTIWNMVNLAIFLFVFIIVCALIGMELFAYRLVFDQKGYPVETTVR
jgi:hypothetical protein